MRLAEPTDGIAEFRTVLFILEEEDLRIMQHFIRDLIEWSEDRNPR